MDDKHISTPQDPADMSARQDPIEPNTRIPPFVVGVGASAGGLQALEELFQHIPVTTRAAFVVVQHLSPDHRSLMAELLAKHALLTVQRAENGTHVEGGIVYVIPPKKNITIHRGRLFLSDLPATRTFNLPIDVFLRSLAIEYEEKSVAVILSGTGSDGTLGVREVKAVGGVVMVQEPESARFDGMPRSAITTRVVDYVLPPKGLGERIFDYISSAPKISEENIIENSPNAVAKILSALQDHSGVDFSVYRFGTLLRRVNKRMQMCRLDTLERYAQYLTESDREVESLFMDVLIGVTNFFRDREAFEALRASVLPSLCNDLPPRATIRVWSAGCSTGEEPYSVGAMLLNHLERNNRKDVRLKVFATDIDTEALRIAAIGSYPMSAMVDVPIELLARFFEKKNDHFRVTERLRRSVIFSRHNICRDPPFNHIDLILCRNLLIYFKPEVQQRVIEIFGFAINPGGALFLGHSETLGDEAVNYKTISQRWKLFRRNVDAPRASLQNLILPPRENRLRPVEKEVHKPRVAPSALREQRLFRMIMQRHAPPSVVIDKALKVLLTFGDMHGLLQLPVGELDLSLTKLANPELASVLSTVAHRLVQSREKIVYNGVSIVGDDDLRHLDIVAEPLNTQDGRDLFLILFHEHKDQGRSAVDASGGENIHFDTSQHLQDLKQELQYTKETLQATIEELETSNEELQATNEELLASNEELQSTNEELQSINEELVTVNSEYQEKILELTQVNNDIENLLANTRLGVIFLDKQMCVRRFTPAVKSVVNLLPSDIGRSIEDLSFKITPADFVTHAQHVLETLIPEDHHVVTNDGGQVVVTIVPYRTIDDMIQGVVLLFSDVTESRRLTRQLDDARERIESLNKGRGIPPLPLQVLLVEDDTTEIELMIRALERNKIHCHIETCKTLASSRERLFKGDQNKLPDLILLDIGLPDGDGIELLEEIKEDEARRHIPVVIVSHQANDKQVHAAYSRHAACFIDKTLGYEALGQIVKSVGTFWMSMVRLPTPGRGQDPGSDE